MAVSIIVVAVILIAVAIYINTQPKSETLAGQAHRLTPQQYQHAFVTPQLPHLLVDVRAPEEFAQGHIPGAINLALPSLPQQMESLPKDRPIVMVCRSGRRSAMAAQMVTLAGYQEVYDLGGLLDWQAQGLPVSRGDNAPGVSQPTPTQ